MRLSDQLTIKIKELIEENGLQAGDRLPSERVLAQQFKTSRPPVREALRALASYGLVKTRPSGGTYLQTALPQWPTHALSSLNHYITDDPHYSYDVLEVRQALERDSARLAALRATEEDKENIQRCYNIMIEHQEKDEPALAAHADAQFHLAIAQASHNVVLLQVMRGVFDLLLTNVEHNRRTLFANDNGSVLVELTKQHHSLLQAILTSNPTAAEQAVCQHLNYISSTQRRWDEDQARQQRAARATL